MSAPSEKHMDVARELSLSSEGIIRPAEFEALARDIATALADEYRRGMERAAEIARQFAHEHRHHSIALPTAGVTIAAAILSDLNTHSPVASSLRRSESGSVSSGAPGTLSEGEGQ